MTPPSSAPYNSASPPTGSSILLAHSYFLRHDPKQVEKMKPYPPLGTLLAASTLRERGFEVERHDVRSVDLHDGVDVHRANRLDQCVDPPPNLGFVRAAGSHLASSDHLAVSRPMMSLRRPTVVRCWSHACRMQQRAHFQM